MIHSSRGSSAGDRLLPSRSRLLSSVNVAGLCRQQGTPFVGSPKPSAQPAMVDHILQCPAKDANIITLSKNSYSTASAPWRKKYKTNELLNNSLKRKLRIAKTHFKKISIYVKLMLSLTMIVKKKTTVDLISESRKTALYSISFEKDGTTEFEKFVHEFERNATYTKDYTVYYSAFASYPQWRCSGFLSPGGQDAGQCCCNTH